MYKLYIVIINIMITNYLCFPLHSFEEKICKLCLQMCSLIWKSVQWLFHSGALHNVDKIWVYITRVLIFVSLCAIYCLSTVSVCFLSQPDTAADTSPHHLQPVVCLRSVFSQALVCAPRSCLLMPSFVRFVL